MQSASWWRCSYRVSNDCWSTFVSYTIRTFSTVVYLADEGHLVEERVLRDPDCFSLIEQTVVAKLAESAETRCQTHGVVFISQFVEGRFVLVP